MSLCLCTSALNFYVCDLPHCVNGVCGHTNHLVCPEQLLFRHSYNNHSVRAINNHMLADLCLLTNRRWDHHGLCGALAREQHRWACTCPERTGTTETRCGHEGINISTRHSLLLVLFSLIFSSPRCRRAPSLQFFLQEPQMWTHRLLGFPNPCTDPAWIQLSQIFCGESEQEVQCSAFWWQRCCKSGPGPDFSPLSRSANEHVPSKADAQGFFSWMKRWTPLKTAEIPPPDPIPSANSCML